MSCKNVVSIIVPVFNAQDYLDKCIRSILSQTYSNIELILINDGSTDCSEEICMNYIHNDHRVIYLNQPNAGPSAARNKGIMISKGEYIQFLDSDDFLNEDSVQILVDAIHKADYVIAGYNNVTEHEEGMKENSVASVLSGLYDKAEFLPHWGEIVEKEIFHYTWNKLYQSKFIKGIIRFDENIKISEDMIFNLDYLNCINTIRIIKEPVYNHVLYNQESLTKRYHEGLFEMRRTTHLYIKKFLYDNNVYNGNNRRVTKELYAKRIKSLLIYLASPKTQMNSGQKLEVIDKIVNDESVLSVVNSFDGGNLSRITSYLIYHKGRKSILVLFKVFGIMLSFKSMLKKKD